MKILLFGMGGQVGWELQRALSPLGTLVSLGRSGVGDLTGDLLDIDGIRQSLRSVEPDIIVNAAAYTAVDRAEDERNLANRINAEAVEAIAKEACILDSLLVHYSTDYVFDGTGETPWCEEDFPAPLNHYGASKLAGENAILQSGCRHLIFRTSWVYAARGNNFLATMERLLRERDSLSIVADQVGAPTSAETIADSTAHAIRRTVLDSSLEGMYHLVASGEASWHGFAAFIAQWLEARDLPLKTASGDIRPIATADYPTKAQRPLNSRLNTTKLQSSFNLTLPHWHEGVQRALFERNF